MHSEDKSPKDIDLYKETIQITKKNFKWLSDFTTKFTILGKFFKKAKFKIVSSSKFG